MYSYMHTVQISTTDLFSSLPSIFLFNAVFILLSHCLMKYYAVEDGIRELCGRESATY